MAKSDESEDHHFYATIKTPPNEFEPAREFKRVLCRLWLPKRPVDRIRMEFYPTQEQANALPERLSPFALRGRKVELPGNTTTIRASQVWDRGVPMRSLSKNRMETVFEADPIDLQVFTTGRPERTKKRRVTAHINYFIAHSSRELSPAKIVKHMGNGTTYAKTVRQFAFTLKGQRRLKFDKRYHYERREELQESVEWTDLVAREKREVPRSEFARIDTTALEDLDDFLLLVSFSAHHRIVCVGMEAYSDVGDHFQFFRKNITVPPKEKQDDIDAVIDLSAFQEFIRVAYRRFVALGPDDLVRHALYLVLPRQNQTAESEYTSLYAALETIVLWHRRRAGLENIIEDGKMWNETREAIGKFLKTQPALQDKERRAMMHLKLGELRRVPFSTAFDHFCKQYSVDLSDLWPVNGNEKTMPLSTIRNHIVHGSVLDRKQLSALFDAREHLRWTVGRMLLAILGWSVTRSNLKNSFLQNFTAMVNLDAARHAMQKLPTLPRSDADASSE